MPFTARLLTLLAVIFFLPACQYMTPLPPLPGGKPVAPPPEPEVPLPPDALRASPRRLVGRITAIDTPGHFAIVTLAAEPPPGALAQGADLIARTDDLRETARLRTSRYVRGRTLGAQIVQGQPTPGDEVVFQVP